MSAGRAGAYQVEATVDDCDYVLLCIYAVQYGPCEYEHRSAAYVPGVSLVLADCRRRAVLLFLVCHPSAYSFAVTEDVTFP